MRTAILFAIATMAFVSSSRAADFDTMGGYCRLVGPSQLMTLDNNDVLRDEVVRLMAEAVNVADSEEWIYSSRPAFVWASEAKVACGKAYGYLQYNVRDEQYLNKCECFYNRMHEYMF